MPNIEKLLLAEARDLLLGLGESECDAEECGVCGPIDEMAARIDAVLAGPVSDAYRRGAEAMREAAVSCAEGPFVDVPERIIASRIRALPIPEDK